MVPPDEPNAPAGTRPVGGGAPDPSLFEPVAAATAPAPAHMATPPIDGPAAPRGLRRSGARRGGRRLPPDPRARARTTRGPRRASGSGPAARCRHSPTVRTRSTPAPRAPASAWTSWPRPAGSTPAALADLARFGLLAGRTVGGDTFYDGDALVVARTAAGFVRFGIEARHLRMYKVAAEREAGFMEQVVMPLLKQRNPTARRQAADNLGELARLGEQLRSALLRGALRDHTDPR